MALALSGSANDQQIAASVVLSVTATGNGYIIAVREDDSGAGSGNPPTATGLTFTLRGTLTVGGSSRITWWRADYTGGFSGNVTIPTADGTTHFLCGVAFGVNGNPTGYDPNGSVPNTSTSSTPAITTTNANDFMFVIGKQTGSSGSGSNDGWTTIANANSLYVGYQLSGAAGSYDFSMNPGVNVDAGSILDAITDFSAPVSATLMGQACL